MAGGGEVVTGGGAETGGGVAAGGGVVVVGGAGVVVGGDDGAWPPTPAMRTMQIATMANCLAIFCLFVCLLCEAHSRSDGSV